MRWLSSKGERGEEREGLKGWDTDMLVEERRYWRNDVREEGEEEKEGRRERHEVNWKYKKSIQKDIYMETLTQLVQIIE